MILNSIERYDFESNWNIWFWISLKDIILNEIERYNFECNWKICFWMELKDMILNFIKNYEKYIQDWYQVCHYLIKVSQFQCFLFQLPNIMLSYKLLLYQNFIERYDFEFHWKIWFWILLKDMILNFIERYDFEFHWKIWFWISLKDMILNFIQRVLLKFYKKLYKILRRLISSLSFVNKSFTISMFSFSTAKYNAVL